LHLAVGAASKRITDLEAAVGAVLLERHSRGVTLTVAGQALQRHAQRILSDVDQLAADAVERNESKLVDDQDLDVLIIAEERLLQSCELASIARLGQLTHQVGSPAEDTRRFCFACEWRIRR
jgi:hypothetical protein